jgi:RHS repeat-associated protein
MNYAYDVASQLTGITYMLGANTLGTLTYAYDLAGRRMGLGGSYARTGTPQAASPATYNVNNQLTNWKGATLTYDANGNLTSDGTNTYTWNARNQLLSISGPVPASFQYDPFGRRVSKTIVGTTQYLYDGANPVQEISGTTASANLLTGGLDEYFQRTDSAGARSFLTDALGSTLALADSTGTLQTSYTFEPFGNTSVTGTATSNSFAYTGRELDATGLYFYRARYYHPTLQRFISEDPIGFAGGDVNLYTYTANSPGNFTDPSGRSNSLIHFPETYLGARCAGLGVGRSLNLAGLAVWVDFFSWNYSQQLDAGDTNIHAMAGQLDGGRYQLPEEAYQGTIDAVNTFGDVGDKYGDALAVHTIADSYSSSHSYRPDRSTLTGLYLSHFFPDLAYHGEASDAICDYLKDRMHGRKTGAKTDGRKYLNPPPPGPVAVMPLPL